MTLYTYLILFYTCIVYNNIITYAHPAEDLDTRVAGVYLDYILYTISYLCLCENPNSFKSHITYLL